MAWQRTDDLDGSLATQFTFGLDGKAYVLDLGDAENQKMHAALQRWLTVAVPYAELPEPPEFPVRLDDAPVPVRKVRSRSATRVAGGGKRTKRRAAVAEANGKIPHSQIRVWANENGYTVGPTGRVPNEVLTAYESAHA